MGIDNGHLPDTVEDRSIRIQMDRATMEEMSKVEPFYSYDCDDEAADIHESLRAFAIKRSAEMRDYRRSR